MLGRNKIATEGRDIQETTSSPVVRRAIPRVGKYSNFLDVTRWFVRDSSMKARVRVEHDKVLIAAEGEV